MNLPVPDGDSQVIEGVVYHPLETVSQLTFNEDSAALTFGGDNAHTLCVSHVSAGEGKDYLLEVTVNRKPVDEWTLAVMVDQQLLLPVTNLRQWRIRVPEPPYYQYEGEDYLPINRLRGAEYELDEQQLTLSLQLPSEWLYASRHGLGHKNVARAVRSDIGAFFNYDLNVENQKFDHKDDLTHSSGFFELGLFGATGVFTQTGIYRERLPETPWVRLESTWRQDDPEQMRTLMLGDTLVEPGSWGNRARFLGISWGTNFATRPDLVTYPQPSISGEAETAATVDIYVNNTRRASTEVPAGPFSLDEVPILTGGGEVELVVRDLLGRETIISQPFYGSKSLLRAGLYDYNVSGGALRERYGQASNQYGDQFFSTTHRLGMTSWLTGEVRFEASEAFQVYGASTSIAFPRLGAAHWTLAQSRDSDGQTGYRREIRVERTGPRFSVGARSRRTDAQFRQLGQRKARGRTSIDQVYVGKQLNGWGSLSASYVDREDPWQKDRIVSIGYSGSIGGASLSLSALNTLGDSHGAQVRGSITIPLGGRVSGSASASRRGERSEGRLTVRRHPRSHGGLRFHASQYMGDRNDRELHTEWQSEVGSYRFASVQRQNSEAYRVGSKGGIAVMDRMILPSDWINNSFAVVTTSGLADIPVYRENRHVTDSRHNGVTLVTGLRAFELNHIRLDGRDLPLDVDLNRLSAEDLVPGFRRGLMVAFDIEKSRSVSLTLVDDNGDVLPAGTQIRSTRNADTFTLGWDGLAYITGLDRPTTYRATVDSGECRFTLAYPDTDDPLPEIGTHVCTLQ